jgi:hypothetical protein
MILSPSLSTFAKFLCTTLSPEREQDQRRYGRCNSSRTAQYRSLIFQNDSANIFHRRTPRSSFWWISMQQQSNEYPSFEVFHGIIIALGINMLIMIQERKGYEKTRCIAQFMLIPNVYESLFRLRNIAVGYIVRRRVIDRILHGHVELGYRVGSGCCRVGSKRQKGACTNSAAGI